MRAETKDCAWLAPEVAKLPPMEDLSIKGRTAYLDAHGPVLWVAWRRLFELALVSREEWLDAAGAFANRRDELEGAEWIASRILAAIRDRATLKRAPAWADIRGWYRWWVGHGRSARAEFPHERSASPEDDPPDDREATGSDGFGEELLIERIEVAQSTRELLEMVVLWADILARAMRSTRLYCLEADWLWATCLERRPLAEALETEALPPRFREMRKRVLTALASVSGFTSRERTARSRRGVAACYRFNLEALVAEHPELAEAHRVFLGPVADPDESPATPALPVTTPAEAQFRQAFEVMAERARTISREDLVEALWARVFGAALNKEVARLLPVGARKSLQEHWIERSDTFGSGEEEQG